jgi:hypothetical protein
MSGNESLIIEDAGGNAAPEIFALTDEQILGMEPRGQEAENGSKSPEQMNDRGDGAKGLTPEGVSYRDEVRARDGKSAQAGVPVPQEPPGWLAREMKDPWVGEEARELWDGVQRAQREAAAYREAIATPEDARALKEIYPGGVAEAKSAAERARELAEIDAVFFGAAGKPAEEMRAERTALVEKLYAQDPAAFREMVEAGVRILGRATSGQPPVTREEGTASARDAADVPGVGGRAERELQPASIQQTARDGAAVAVPQEVVSRYREFERATNAELEKSVGGAIGRAMQAALPNLRHASVAGGEAQAPPLQERLRAAVREEVETALRSDASLGEQVARILSGRRLDEAARAQVVRLIDGRAQQLVPGAVRRVVGSWTQAMLGTRRTDAGAEPAARDEQERRAERTANSSQRTASGDSTANGNASTSAGRSLPRRRVDYRKMSDEQILGM